MKEYTHATLNIKRLLELGDLDIRGIAAENKSISADEYFSKIDKFIENSPNFTEILVNASKLGENIKILKELESKLGVSERSVNFAEDTKKTESLEEIKNTLTEIGCAKLNFDIDSMSKAIKTGDFQLSEKIGREVFIKFDLLLERVKSAQTTKKFANARFASSAGSTDNDTVLLSEALEYLDYEEDTRKLRILAVDDVTVVLNTISSILSPYYDVFALKNSSHVEKFLEHTTPELFLLDIEMSEMSGFDLVPLIRSFEEHKDTPIIFLTGNASFNNLKDAISLGARDFITKPVNRDILLEKIEKNIVRKRAY